MKIKSFIKTFQDHVGETEVPKQFFKWSAISLMASALGDRIWFEKFAGSRLLPNLYTILIGPSGLGKGIAIDAMQEVAQGMESRLGFYRGAITAPAIVDHLSHKAKMEKISDPTRFYLVTPELSLSVGSGEMADRLVKLMTELYTGGDYTYHEATRTNQDHIFRVPTMNWHAGSTEDWLVNSISRDAISSGFFARCITVRGEYDFSKQICQPLPHPQRDLLLQALRRRVHTLATKVGGPMVLSKQARELNVFWYEHREVPHDEALLPSWKRAHDLSLKLAMLFAKDVLPYNRVVLRKHLQRGQLLAEQTQEMIPHLITLASCTPESDALRFVQRIIQGSESGIDDTELVWRASQRGMTKERTQSVVDTLIHAKRVIATEKDSDRVHYKWRTRTLK